MTSNVRASPTATTDPATSTAGRDTANQLAPALEASLSLSSADEIDITDIGGSVLVSSDPLRLGSRADLGSSDVRQGRGWSGLREVDGRTVVAAHAPVLADDDGTPDPVHSIASGLDYPGVGPQHAHFARVGRVRYVAEDDAAGECEHRRGGVEGEDVRARGEAGAVAGDAADAAGSPAEAEHFWREAAQTRSDFSDMTPQAYSENTYYAWKKKFSGLGVSELRRLRQLEEENRKLKQLVADLSLDKAMLQDVLLKKL